MALKGIGCQLSTYTKFVEFLHQPGDSQVATRLYFTLGS